MLLFIHLLLFLYSKPQIYIKNTTLREGSLVFKYHDTPYRIFIDYPSGVKFSNNRIKRCIEITKDTVFCYTKNLCKEYEYDYYFEKGIKFKIYIFCNGSFFYEELLDWISVPDLSMIFMGFNITAIMINLVLKALID
ncbi:hypothetical protein P3W45_000848 [Vairimorpha bombi]|jgi:hypothetical protein